MTMSKESPNREGLVKGILGEGDLATQEIKEELWRKNVSFVRSYDRAFSGLFLALAILWLLPAVAEWSDRGFLRFFAQLPRVDFPIAVIVIGAILFIAAVSLEIKLNSMRQKQGGCHDMHETVVIVKEGPYRVIRHPGYLAEMVYFSVLPIVLSKWVPFTVLAAICIVIAIASCAYLIKAEDSFNLRKWGEEYRQYMKEVPAINFVRGLKRLKEGIS
jgi:protein-S-isoprenylcysteine O-methyltransferase Ste14